jgi:hypothetical protein
MVMVMVIVIMKLMAMVSGPCLGVAGGRAHTAARCWTPARCCPAPERVTVMTLKKNG